ncbi:MAG: site-specific integrase [Promicromonosporaceae bacterium]|nr:site-specific integrase [Promicromonosporaceae bacterium]
MNSLATALQRYFTVFAHNQRDLSPATITAYRDAWRLLLKFLVEKQGRPADRIDFSDITADNVVAFLDHLQNTRGNGASTRNARLAAIRAVLSNALPDHPEHAATINRVLMVPMKRHPKPNLEYLVPNEIDSLLAAPDQTSWTGRRDHAWLTLSIQTGLRVSELSALEIADVTLPSGANVTCTGKGRKNRSTPLTKQTVSVMTNYLQERKIKPGTALFCGPHGTALSRDAFEHRLAIHLAAAASVAPTLTGKKITMHSLRHTTAMELLSAGVDISVIALWLGHQQTNTTDIYLHASMEIKQNAIDRTRPHGTTTGKYRPAPDILAWLNTL